MYIFSATVIKGEGRGRQLGFPTANLDKTDLELEFGVYLADIRIREKKHRGLLHFGPKKTFNDVVSAEVYIDDFNADIHGETVEVSVIKKIRDIMKFKDADALVKQMKKDEEYISDF